MVTRVIYWRKRDALEVDVPPSPKPLGSSRVTTMLLALTTPTGNRSALPPRSRTLPQAELFHRAIVGRVAQGGKVQCPEITGLDPEGKPLRDRHLHAHILPIDLDSDGHLDHILIYAPMGFGDAAQTAIRTLRQTWMKGGAGDLQLTLAGSGDLHGLRALPAPFDRRVEQLLAPVDGSCVWTSITPFVPPRFMKARGANTLQGQINAELASRGLPPVEHLEEVPRTPETLVQRHFVRRRQRGAQPPIDVGYTLRLRFAQPIAGPLALGYASHFGLGLFEAEL